jgi:hypothetical protein
MANPLKRVILLADAIRCPSRPSFPTWANGDMMVAHYWNDAPRRSPCPEWHYPGAETAPGQRADKPLEPSPVLDRFTASRRCPAGASRDELPDGKPRPDWFGLRTIFSWTRTAPLRCLQHASCTMASTPYTLELYPWTGGVRSDVRTGNGWRPSWRR